MPWAPGLLPVPAACQTQPALAPAGVWPSSVSAWILIRPFCTGKQIAMGVLSVGPWAHRQGLARAPGVGEAFRMRNGGKEAAGRWT